MIIGLIGANGFVGSEIQRFAKPLDGIKLICINRDNYKDNIGGKFNVLINLAGNKRNFWANQFPHKDFEMSTGVVYNSLFDFSFDKYVFISSVAVYDEKSHYGFNKLLSEKIIQRYSKEYLILRSSGIIDKNMSIGIISDIKKGIPSFVTYDSKFQFITRQEVVKIIFDLLPHNSMCINMGGVGSVTVQELQDFIGTNVTFKSDAVRRDYEMDVSELQKIVKLKTTADYVKSVL